MIHKTLSLYYLHHFSSTSCCFPSGITLKIVAFQVAASWLCCCVHSRKKKKTTTTTTGSTCFSNLLSRHFPPYFIACSNVSRAGYNRSFSNDVTGAIFLYKTMDRRLCLCTNKILWEMNSFHMLKPSFIPSNLQSCWPRDWKRSTYCSNASGYIWF